MAGCAAGLPGWFGDAVLWRLGRPVTCVPGTVGGRWRGFGLGGRGANSGWSSARALVAGNGPWALIGIEECRRLRTRTEWADALNRRLPEPELRRLRLATRSGAPYGSEEFVRSLEEKTGRCLESRGRGRPRRRDMAVSACKMAPFPLALQSTNVWRSPAAALDPRRPAGAAPCWAACRTNYPRRCHSFRSR